MQDNEQNNQLGRAVSQLRLSSWVVALGGAIATLAMLFIFLATGSSFRHEWWVGWLVALPSFLVAHWLVALGRDQLLHQLIEEAKSKRGSTSA